MEQEESRQSFSALLKLPLNVIWEAFTTGRPSIIDPSSVDYGLRFLFVPVTRHLVLSPLLWGLPAEVSGGRLIELQVNDQIPFPICLLDFPPPLIETLITQVPLSFLRLRKL